MKTPTLVALRSLAAMAALFVLGGVLWTPEVWRSANEALVQQAYDMNHQAIRAILMDGRDLLIAWPGMGEGTEAGTRELVVRLESVREALVPGQDTSWSTLDARSRQAVRLKTHEVPRHTWSYGRE